MRFHLLEPARAQRSRQLLATMVTELPYYAQGLESVRTVDCLITWSRVNATRSTAG